MIKDILSEKEVTFSCEMFPPKPGADMARFEETIRAIAELKPDFISVTYGAGGSTPKRTLEIATEIQDIYQVPALAHLTCVASTREEIAANLSRM